MNQNSTALLILTLLVAAGGYWYFFSGDDAAVATLTEQTSSTPGEQRFQSLVSELEPISFDTSLFADPRFMGLVDLSTTITPEASGRLDPFAPIGSGESI